MLFHVVSFIFVFSSVLICPVFRGKLGADEDFRKTAFRDYIWICVLGPWDLLKI